MPFTVQMETGSEREGAGPGSHRKQHQDLDWEFFLCHPTLPQHPSPPTDLSCTKGRGPTAAQSGHQRRLSHPKAGGLLCLGPRPGPPTPLPSARWLNSTLPSMSPGH